MTVTLDTKTLSATRFREKTEAVSTTADAFESGTYKRKFFFFGNTRQWELEVEEENVTWTNSNAKYFQGKIGVSINLTVTEPPHNINLSVYIVEIDVEYEGGTPNHRQYTLSLVEA